MSTLTRPAAATAIATTLYIASGGLTQLLSPANPERAEIRLQGAGPFAVGVAPSLSASAGQLVPSGVTFADSLHLGALYGFSEVASGATVAIRLWETARQITD